MYVIIFFFFQIWDLSDPIGKGYLEKTGFYVALKMVALAQSNQDLHPQGLTNEAPQPNLVWRINDYVNTSKIKDIVLS